MENGLQDLFRFENGRRVENWDDWLKRREELLELILSIEYGHLPPTPTSVKGLELHNHVEPSLLNAQHIQYHVTSSGPEPWQSFRFLMDVLIPPGDGPFPVVINGDGCWRYLTEDVTRDVLGRGYALAAFNRVEIVPDNHRMERATGLYQVYPDGDFGALAAWAWGYHRCVDVLLEQPYADSARIAVVGHSRGGKAVLLAGATDERIALTAPNNSGCGGAGCFRHAGKGAEKISGILGPVAYWFSRRFKDFIDREDALPFDQHCLKALVAPRALLSTEALGDLWANPSGTWQTHLAAKELYRHLGAEGRIGFWFRDGPHGHGGEDWAAFLDFADWSFRGKKTERRFDQNPFPDAPPAFTWSAPGQQFNNAIIPVTKLEEDSYDWFARHHDVLRAVKKINPEIVLIGDSITNFWGGEPKSAISNGPEEWKALFESRRVLNLGFGWDRSQNVLWRLSHGEFDNIRPKVVVINIGTNNLTGTPNCRGGATAEIVEGIRRIIELVKAKAPAARIILMGVFPRGEKPNDPIRPMIQELNKLLKPLGGEPGVTFLDIGQAFLQPDGSISKDTFSDFCHPGPKGYRIWADALERQFKSIGV